MKATYIKTRLSSVINLTKIVTIHVHEFDERFVFDGEQHDFWEMVYVDKGSVLVRSGDHEHVMEQGEIVFHAPNEFHSIRSYHSSPNFFVISFVCNSDAMKYFVGYHASLSRHLQPFLTAALREAEQTYEIPKNEIEFRRLQRKDTAPIGGEQMIKTYLEQLFVQLMRQTAPTAAVFPSREQMETHLLTVVKQYIDRHLCEAICIADICREIGYSKTYLCRLFHEQSGDTVAHYITVCKIERAKSLIREGTHNFAEISDMLAFDNPQYFSRVFRRVTGMSPTEFKLSLAV